MPTKFVNKNLGVLPLPAFFSTNFQLKEIKRKKEKSV